MPDSPFTQSCAPENDAAAIEAALGRQHWSPGLEILYEHQRGPARRARTIRTMVASGLLLLGAILLDPVAGPDALSKGVPWRLAGCALILGCAAGMRRCPVDPRMWRMELTLTIVAQLAMMMVTQYIGEYGGRWADRYMMAAAFAIAAYVSTTPLTLRSARWLCASALAAYPIIPWLLPHDFPLRTNVDMPLLAAGMLATALLVARRNESVRRISFLYRRQLETAAVELNVMNAELLRLSVTDPLTGLKNRRAFTQALNMHWRDRRQPLALAILDVDWFKAFNDSAGHAAGDAALQAVAGATDGAVRYGVDLAARIGGEEFAVIMPGLDQDQAHHLAERLRREISMLALPHPGRPGRTLSISVGVAWCTQADRCHQSPDAFMNQADAALYAAKAAGRDRVVVAGPPPCVLAG